MQNVQKNIENKLLAKQEVEKHCMCLRLKEEGNKAIIVYPYSVRGIGGLRVDNSAQGLTNAISYMEKAWQDSLLGY